MKRVILPLPQIIARYQRGERLQDMAEDYGCCYATLRKRLVKAGAIRKPGRRKGQKSGPRQPNKLDEIRLLRRRKMTYQQIADLMGMTKQGVHQYVKTHLGVPKK